MSLIDSSCRMIPTPTAPTPTAPTPPTAPTRESEAAGQSRATASHELPPHRVGLHRPAEQPRTGLDDVVPTAPQLGDAASAEP